MRRLYFGTQYRQMRANLSMSKNNYLNTKRIAMIAILSTLSFVGRIMFTFLPNVQPTTTIILLITFYIGTRDGLLVAIISLLISNIYMGMGVWTIAQLGSYTLIVLIMSLLSKIPVKNRNTYLSLLCFSSGILYGLFISLIQAPFFGWMSFIPYYINGIPFDVSHAVGNLGFFVILHPLLKTIFINQKLKIN